MRALIGIRGMRLPRSIPPVNGLSKRGSRSTLSAEKLDLQNGFHGTAKVFAPRVTGASVLETTDRAVSRDFISHLLRQAEMQSSIAGLELGYRS